LLFISVVEYKFAFVLVALLATFIPDADSKFSTLGKRKSLRVLQFFIKHRGVMHSFGFLILITLFLVLFFPIISLGFSLVMEHIFLQIVLLFKELGCFIL